MEKIKKIFKKHEIKNLNVIRGGGGDDGTIDKQKLKKKRG